MLQPFARLLSPVLSLLCFVAFISCCNSDSLAADMAYYSLQAVTAQPAAPASLSVQSPGYLDLPAGAALSVHLLKGEQVVATSRLTLTAAYHSDLLLPSVPVAAFLPAGSGAMTSQPLPGATLTAGTADLNDVLANPASYRLLWQLSAGRTGRPGQAIAGGDGVGFLALKLAGVAAAFRQSDQKPGSVLFYPRYTSGYFSPQGENTTVSLTNTSPTDAALVRLYFVDAQTGIAADSFVCLAAQQSLSFQTIDYDPGVKGYLIAVAVDAQGRPAQFNYLIGHAQLRQPAATNGQLYDVSLPALAFAKRSDGAVAASGGVAELAFDDVMYDRLPNALAADNVPSQVNSANATQLLLLRPPADVAGTGAATPINLRLTAYGPTAAATTAGKSFVGYTETALASLRFTPTALNTLLPKDVTGWVKVAAADDGVLLGLQFNAGRYTGGASLRALGYAADYRLKLPVSALSCQ